MDFNHALLFRLGNLKKKNILYHNVTIFNQSTTIVGIENLQGLFGIQTVQPCEAETWHALSPDQNNIKLVNMFTYLNRPGMTAPHTPENASQNLFSCPRDSATLRKTLNWVVLSLCFKLGLTTNILDDSNRGH